MYGRETDLDKKLEKVREEEEQSSPIDVRVHAGKTCEIPADLIRAEKGTMNTIEVQADERGRYLLEMELRSGVDNDLAQIPMAIHIGSHYIDTISIQGSQKEWKKIAVELPLVRSRTFYLKFFFALGGMEIRSCRLSRLEKEETE